MPDPRPAAQLRGQQFRRPWDNFLQSFALFAKVMRMPSPPKDFFVVLVTAPSVKVARLISRAALESRLVACANIVAKIESHYWWKGSIQKENEVLILFKTTNARLVQLEKSVLEKHPYETPEFVVLPIRRGNKRYLAWLSGSVR